jgi:hypothetical protein
VRKLAQVAVELVQLRAGQPRADAGRDDRAGRGSCRQPEEFVARPAQVLLQDGQRTGDHHAPDAAAVNGDGYVFAKRFHILSPFTAEPLYLTIRREGPNS